ncbi:MAG: ABC transporter substrate-binding protein [Ilumatobacteraceae bacterium]|nr:ABC transporter substrate-binding protein [Ilumatobacteraceae bacterium]
MKKQLRTSVRAFAAALAVSSITLVTACGSSSSSDTTVAVDTPQRIVSLSATATEMLYAIGAGSQVVAVDEYSNYPAEAVALGTKLNAFEPNIEAIAAYTPDLVIISNDMSSVTERLADLDIKVWVGTAAATIDDAYAQITQLGEATGHVDEAAQVVETIKDGISAAVDGVKAPAGTSYFYELDNTYYTVTSNTFIGSLMASLGLTNIADGVESGNDYPQLNAEALIKSNPSMIFLADTKCCAQSAATVAARPGWTAIAAITNNAVVELDDDISSRWGPRVVDLVKQIAATVKALK